MIFYAMLVALIFSFAEMSRLDAFSPRLQYRRRIEQPASRFNLMATSAATSLYDDVIRDILHSANEALHEHKTELKHRPGLPYSLGCDTWAAGSNYTGNVSCWNAAKGIRWLSYCITQNAAIGDSCDSVHSMLDMYIFSDNDIPHFRLTVSKESNNYVLLLDFIPRCDLIQSMSYFDNYFYKFDETIYTIVNECSRSGSSMKALPISILTKLLLSPLNIYIEIPDDAIGIDYMKSIIGFYMKRYQEWIRNSVKVGDIINAEGEIVIGRDKSLQKLLLDEIKFKYAYLMGSSFAPKVRLHL
jgi:hypothetical protein